MGCAMTRPLGLATSLDSSSATSDSSCDRIADRSTAAMFAGVTISSPGSGVLLESKVEILGNLTRSRMSSDGHQT